MSEFKPRFSWNFSVPSSIKLPVQLLAFITLVSSFLSITFYFSIQPEIPLLYSLSQPEQQLVTKEWIFIFPAILLFITIVHSWILFKMTQVQELLTQLFSLTSIIIALLFLISQLRILYLIT